MFNTMGFGAQLNFSSFTPASMGGGNFPGFGGLTAPTGPALGGGCPAGMFSPSNELGQDSSFGAVAGLMQVMAQSFALSQMMAQMSALLSLWNGGAGGGVPVAGGPANFGKRGPNKGGKANARPSKDQKKAKKSKGHGSSDSGSSSAADKGGRAGKSSRAGKSKTGKIVNVPGGKVDSSIAGAVKAMMAAAKKDGVTLGIESSFRSRAEQEKLYAAYKNGTGNLAAKPGTSNHESGLAIDFKNTPGAYDWLAKNAGKFGLKNLHGEPWHYSPSGT